MRPLGVVLSLVVVAGAIWGTIWAARYAPWVHRTYGITDPWDIKAQKAKQEAEIEKEKHDQEQQKVLAEIEAERPPICTVPPFPKVGPCEKVFQFGRMAVSEEKSHTFQIRNIGEGPLKLSKGRTTCKCTINNLSKKTLGPGETADIMLSWTPKEVAQTFAQTAIVFTNDPDLSQIEFKILGIVGQRFLVSPVGVWSVEGAITDAHDGEASGFVGSDHGGPFKITSIESSDPHLKGTAKQLTAREAAHQGMKNAYKVIATVDRGAPMGDFRGRLKVHTTIDGSKTIDLEVAGHRSGPILFLPPIGSAVWRTDRQLLALGRFPHAEGKKASLPALIYAMKDEFKVLDIKSEPDFVKVSVERNPNAAGAAQQGVRFVFEVPPGAPAVTRITPDSGHVTLTTNHPTLKTLKFELEFASY